MTPPPPLLSCCRCAPTVRVSMPLVVPAGLFCARVLFRGDLILLSFVHVLCVVFSVVGYNA